MQLGGWQSIEDWIVCMWLKLWRRVVGKQKILQKSLKVAVDKCWNVFVYEKCILLIIITTGCIGPICVIYLCVGMLHLYVLPGICRYLVGLLLIMNRGW